VPVPNPDELYEVATDLPELGRPVLIQAMTGFVDAGGATRLAADHLLATLDPKPAVTFDVDLLLDYRARRPIMTFVEDHWASYDEPRLVINVLHDEAGVPFLLLTGPEPDVMWRRFSTAVRHLIDRLGVRLTVGLNAIPMAVPHTRPTGITAHATRKDLIVGYEPWIERVLVPGSSGHLLEWELGQEGKDAVGFAVHVPHYLAQTDYPGAAELLLTSVSRATGLLLPTEGLHAAAERLRGDIDQRIAADTDARALVRALEEQYDTFVRGREGNLLTSTGPLPTAEELGAEFERFLAEQSKPDDPRPGAGFGS
jgi:predicted ATP-grasp superfamily ATP-dependent carboligase